MLLLYNFFYSTLGLMGKQSSDKIHLYIHKINKY